MGDIADMMLEGDLCATCGVYMDGDGDGSPRYCKDCIGDARKHGFVPPKEKTDAQRARAKRKRQKYAANKRAKRETAARGTA